MTDIQKIQEVVAKFRANPKLARDGGIVIALLVLGACACAALGVDLPGLFEVLQEVLNPQGIEDVVYSNYTITP